MTAASDTLARDLGPPLRRPKPGLVRFAREVIRRPTGAIGVAILGLLIFAAVFAPLLSLHEPNQQFSGNRLVSPNGEFWLGTDEFSRDLWTRVLYGLRISLMVGFGAVLIGSVAGSLIGLLAGFFGGPVDTLLTRTIDAMLAFPAIVAAIAIVTALGSGVGSIALAIALFNIPVFARLARASALVERERDYVLAAQSIGAGKLRQLIFHITPNAVIPLFVQLAFSISFAVLLEAGLSFLGMGTQPPDPSIGGMLNASRSFMYDSTTYVVLPGLAIVLLLASLNMLADTINDIVDPRSR